MDLAVVHHPPARSRRPRDQLPYALHAFIHDGFLLERGLSNYWGYHTIGYFAPHAGYAHAHATTGVVAEFKQMVRALHQAGIEVILDVVYNHTAEGNHEGPMLSMRGLDNAAYYRLCACRTSSLDFHVAEFR